MKLLAQAAGSLVSQALVCPGDRVLVAVSGGADSVALLSVLDRIAARLDLTLAVAHVDHGLRGAESDQDAAFVAEMAKSLSLDCFTARAEVAREASSRGISIEMAAREARYRCLQEIALDWKARAVATAHTADDLAETLLLFLARGAGPRALRGFPWKRRLAPGVDLIRPFRDVRHAELVAWLGANGIAWRHDRTNEDTAWPRNLIRHEVLPRLERDLNPRVVEALGRAADRWSEADEFIAAEAAAALASCLVPGEPGAGRVVLDASRLRGYHHSLYGRVLGSAASLVMPRPLDTVQVSGLVGLVRAGRGTIDLPADFRAVVRGNQVIIEPGSTRKAGRRRAVRSPGGLSPGGLPPRPSVSEPIPVPGRTPLGRVPEGESFLLASVEEIGDASGTAGGPVPVAGSGSPGGCDGYGDARGRTAVFDWDTLHPPLVLRHPRPGDRMRPLGMRGTRKLQDILVDRRVPREARPDLWVVQDQERILWLVGIVMCEEGKVTGGTTRRLVLERVGA